MRKRWKVRVTFKDGESVFVERGSGGGQVAVFLSRKKAEECREMFEMGAEDDVQSIDVVQA